MTTINPQVYSLPEGATSTSGLTETTQGALSATQHPGTFEVLSYASDVPGVSDGADVGKLSGISEGIVAVPQYDGIPETGSLEQLAGVPTAAELSALANSLFPDLTGEFNNAGINAEPEVCAEGIDDLVQKGDTTVFSTAENKSVQAYEHLFHEEGSSYGEYLNHAENSYDKNGEFDWEHPFGYGGASTDDWLKGVEAVNDPANAYLQDAAKPESIVTPNTKSYSPAVVSQEQAKKNDRAVNAPTSLGGDKVRNGNSTKSEGTTRNDTIIVGSKTLAQIRDDFPILKEQINGNQLVWLDNGATTQRPKAVIDRLTYYYEHENSNVHRGAHTLAARSTDAYENARETVRRFIGAPSANEIVFVRGTTEAINLVANAYVKPTLQPGDEIIVSILEHHANIVPWQLIAEETGAVIKVIPCDKDGQLELHEYEKLFTKRTKFVSVTHVSNVLGTVTPVEELVAIAHRHGVRILIDGAQSVAHIPVNVSALDADFFVFSGHKIFAPTGIGVVYGKKELLEAARPYHGGGNMIADVTFERTIYNPAPNKFEAGTGSIADAVGLGAALEYLEAIGMPSVNKWEHELLQYAIAEMKKVKGLHLIGTAANKASVLSFKLDGYSDEEVGERLNSYGIAVRTGHHCAQPVLRHFGYEGSVRPTLALYNSPDDIDALVKVLKTFA